MQRTTTSKRWLAALLGLGLLATAPLGAQEIGDIWCTDGSFVKPADWATATGKTAKGVVFWVDPASPTHGLACALKDAGTGKWCLNNTTDVPTLTNVTGFEDALGDMAGQANTQALRALTPATDYPAANLISAADIAAGWYMPAIGELNLLYTHYAQVAPALQKVVDRDAGTATTMNNNFYWSSMECSASAAWSIDGDGYLGNSLKVYVGSVRAVAAF